MTATVELRDGRELLYVDITHHIIEGGFLHLTGKDDTHFYVALSEIHNIALVRSQ